MATHSSVLAWRIPGTGEPGGLLSMGSHRVGHDWSNLAAAAAAHCQICICMMPRASVVKKWKWHNAGSRRETFHSWQRSWGRGLGIRKGGIEPRECPQIFSSIYPPKNQSLPTLLLCALTSDFTGGCSPPPSHSLCQRVNLQLQLIKFLGN